MGEGSKLGKSPKVARRGCKRSFGPTAQRSPKSHLHHVQPYFAPVQPQCKRLFARSVQKTFCTLSKPLSGIFLFSTPLPGALVCKLRWATSPIAKPSASVQRTRSTLADRSGVPRGTVARMNANRRIQIAAQQTQGLCGPISVFLGGGEA